MRGDLHCHTKLSDGSLGIEDLITLAKKRGIEAIAITDHDCLAGTVRGKIIGDRFGVQVIPGVELSATDTKTGKKVHLLCYLSDAPDRLEGLCHRNSLARKKAAHYMMLQVAKRYPVAAELIVKCATGSTNIYKQHIMQALMECGFSRDIYGEMYHKLFDKDSPESVLVTPKYPDIEEVLTAIHDAGGIAVLAHPYFFDNLDSLPRLIENGLDGIEVWHPCATEEQQAELKKIATKNKLLMTGGTDFHGLYNLDPVSIGDVLTPDDAMAKLLGYKAKQKRLARKAAKAAAAAQLQNDAG
ncbi:MAG TPA: PHP domain-containing protein [Candidatus Fimenecus excrementavium]|nr:PHP domain-containing protein [Candidatus Fimenecus excrementavium]